MSRQVLGRAGEDRVLEWYLTRGFFLLDRNWHDGPRGELDLVLGFIEDGPTPKLPLVVTVEVKTRRTDTYGSGLEAVTPPKQLRLRRLTAAWMQAHRELLDEHGMAHNVDLRIDVAAVRLDRTGAHIDVVEGAC
jgi:putative endonuclease